MGAITPPRCTLSQVNRKKLALTNTSQAARMLPLQRITKGAASIGTSAARIIAAPAGKSSQK